jgi:hypothetical protein
VGAGGGSPPLDACARPHDPHPHPLPTRGEGRSLWLALVLIGLLGLASSLSRATAQDALSAKPSIDIAFVEIEDDPRYAPMRAYERIILKTARIRSPGRGSPSTTRRRSRACSGRLPPAAGHGEIGGRRGAGDRRNAPCRHALFLIDAPAKSFRPLAAAVHGREALLFNVSEPDDSLRRTLCAVEFVYTYPSRAQLTNGSTSASAIWAKQGYRR